MHHPASRPAAGHAVAYPLLLECDSSGHVLWMSEWTRSALGSAKNLADTIETATRLWPPERAGALRFWRIMATGNGMLLAVQSEGRTGISVFEALEGAFLHHYFRLGDAERRLAAQTRALTRGGSAVRQLERERQRLGRELHTGVGQTLAAIRLQLEAVGAKLVDAPAPVGQGLDRIYTLAGDALEQVRSLSRRLHPPEWQRLRLEAAIQQLWEISGIPEKYQGSLSVEPLTRDPDPEIKALIYRSAQEALSNLARHSRATRVGLRLGPRDGKVVLAVEDDGVGFDANRLFSAPATLAAGIGLRSIRDLAASAGGILLVESGPAGTKLEIAAPYSPTGS